ncbi:MAG: type II secretion system protein GspM [Parvularcula sp.]|jgi:general secretion pathway protein M|nr:type II secretion system protein GspM [Parvularcula sp.]
MIASLIERFSPRERQMLGGLTVFLVLLVLIFGVVLPLNRFAENAVRDYATSARLAALSEELAPASAQRGSGSNLRSAVTNTANQKGVVISRINAGAEDEIEVALNNVAYGAFWSWLRTLEETEGVVAREAYVSPGDSAGSIEARLTLVREG